MSARLFGMLLRVVGRWLLYGFFFALAVALAAGSDWMDVGGPDRRRRHSWQAIALSVASFASAFVGVYLRLALSSSWMWVAVAAAIVFSVLAWMRIAVDLACEAHARAAEAEERKELSEYEKWQRDARS